jgi:glyoxylase-like metal-dependent hydrolase (beta-lactamase superfamily II)
MKLFDNLNYYLWEGKGNNCNTYAFTNVLRGDRPHVLIDPGHVVNETKEHCLEQLLVDMGGDGIKPEDIGLIINTHAHWDHFQATRALVQLGTRKGDKAGQPLVTIHENEKEYLASVMEYMSPKARESIALEPSFYLTEGDLALGNSLNLRILNTPGHTPGSLTLYWPDRRLLITGDLLFYGGVGRTDFGGDGEELKQSIERLMTLDVEYVLPGHSTELGAIIKGKDRVQKNFTLIKMSCFPML